MEGEKSRIWQADLVEKSCRSTAHYLLDYAGGEGDFAALLSRRHWGVKVVEEEESRSREARMRHALKPITHEEMKNLEEMSFSVATWWNCPLESTSLVDTLTRLRRVIVESGSVLVCASPSEVSMEQMAEAAREAGLGIEETLPYPLFGGLLAPFKNCYYKRNLTAAPRLVYHLRRKEILDFRVLYK